MFAVVLVHPEIPPNTGNVIRLTANAGVELHLVEPLGFRLDDRDLKRAGLDYHEYASLRVHRDFAACRAALAVRRAGGTRSRRAARAVAYDARFAPDDVLVFGCETSRPAGRHRRVRAGCSACASRCAPGLRSLNLSNAVAVAVYEAWRQNGFAGAG